MGYTECLIVRFRLNLRMEYFLIFLPIWFSKTDSKVYFPVYKIIYVCGSLLEVFPSLREPCIRRTKQNRLKTKLNKDRRKRKIDCKKIRNQFIVNHEWRVYSSDDGYPLLWLLYSVVPLVPPRFLFLFVRFLRILNTNLRFNHWLDIHWDENQTNEKFQLL